jgi:outer membrane receptor protein involved in Fe transport
MTRFKFCKVFISLSLFLAVSSFDGFGQSASATISGSVTDSGTAVIAGASIELTSVERGTSSSTATNSVGLYIFPSVQPGTYRMVVQSPGFKQATALNVIVDVGSQLSQNFQLEVGSVKESVTVETTEPLVNTLSSTVSSVVTGAPIQDLPLNGRDTLQLALTEPGVTPQTIGAPGSTQALGGFVGNGFSVAGGRSNSVTFMLDGGVNNTVSNSVATVDPNPDTVAEFRILVNNYSAEYGRSNGGIVNVVTKSGTNEIHGTAYDYLRNSDLNANNFFNQATPGSYSPRPTLDRNQFGITMGGPLTIPKVVNGKDRFFWFFGYQGQRQDSVTVESQVGTFTPAELAGNFSQAANNAGIVQFLQTHPSFQPNPALAAQAIISPAAFDPIAKAFIAEEPIPTSPNGILTPNGTAQDNVDQFVGKTDFNITPNQRLSVTLVRNHEPQLVPFPNGPGSVSGYPALNTADEYFGGITFTSVITPSLLNEAHFTAQRLLNNSGVSPTPLPTATSLGMKITPDLSDGPPTISFGVEGLNLGLASSSPGRYADTTYSWTDNVSWNVGKHNFKLGGQFAIVQNNGEFAYETNGTFTYSGPVASGGIGTGNDLADFLLGLPNVYSQYPNAFSAAHGQQYAGFAQDEWRVRSNFTLTLGVRYEYDSPKHDPQEKNYFLLPGQQSTKYPLAPEGLLFPCDPGAPCPGTYYPDKNNWAPRFGYAWDPFGKGRTSIRGGFGVFYDVLNGQDVQWQNGTPPFYSASELFFTSAQVPANGNASLMSNPYGAAGQVNPFPSRPLSPSTNFASAGFLPFGPSSVLIDPNQRNPYTYGWNTTIQQALWAGMALQVGYVGSSSHKLIVNEDPDSFVPGTLLRPLNLQPGLQYPDAYAQMSVDKSIGSANYEGLLTSLTKRMGDLHGFGSTFFTIAYTYSKTMSDQDAYRTNISSYNQHQFYAPSTINVPRRFVLSGGWELPFAHLWESGPKRLTTGWSLYPIFSTQAGMPVDFSAGISQTSTNPGPAGDGDPGLVRPDWAGGSQQMLNPANVETFTVNGKQVTGHFFFNPSALYTPACFASKAIPGSDTPGACPAATYGDLQRNTLVGPGLTNFDLSLEKKTNLYNERVQLLFRAEFFNVLNHTEFLGTVGQISIRSALIGQSTSTNPPRIGQLALKLVF